MIRRSLAFVLAGFVLYIGAQAQTPVPAPAPKPEAQSFSFFFDGDGSYLGVQTEEITKDNFAKYGLKEVRGVAVEKVMEGSPAEKAGIQTGDVIIRLDGEEVTSIRKLTRLLGEVAPDHQVRVTVLRGGSERDLTATLAKRPMAKFDDGNFKYSLPPDGFKWSVPPDGFKWSMPPGEFPKLPDLPAMPKWETPQIEPFPPGTPEPFFFKGGSGRRLGIGVTTLTKQLSEHFGVTSGVIVNEVRADSAAAKAGLRAGDIIIEADGKEVKGDGDLIRAINEKKEGDVNLTVVRGGNRQTIRVTPEKVEGGFQFDVPNTPDPPQFQYKLNAPLAPTPMVDFKFPGRIL